MTSPLLLSEEEAAARLLVCPRTLRRLRMAGEIRYVALAGRRIAYRLEDCLAYIESRLKLETPSQAIPRPRNRQKRNSGANVLSFTARREARIAGQR